MVDKKDIDRAGLHSHFRMDFVLEGLSTDDATRTFSARLRLDPRRYEEREVNGEAFYYDRLDDIYISRQEVAEMIQKVPGLPFSFSSQKVGDASEYIRTRKPNILASLKGGASPAPAIQQTNEFLATVKVDTLAFAVLSLDVVGSTKLAMTLPPDEYAGIMRTLLFELSALVPLFHGQVLSYGGDGLIAYFPAPSFINKNDLAIDCAATMRKLVYEGLNPVLAECGSTPIDIRIGVDAGEAAVVVVGSAPAKQQADLLGSAINLACKIQSVAPAGTIAVGNVAFKNIHTGWRLQCVPMDVGPAWEYTDPFTGKPYPVYCSPLGR